MPTCDHPENFRAYGVLLRHGRVLISAEYVFDVFCWKFPGGGVDAGETASQAIVREFHEETGLTVEVGLLLHSPGTLFSPWSHANYTPVYHLVSADGDPVVPDHEPVEMTFRTPDEAVASGLMAEPETVALRRALRLSSRAGS